MGLDTSHGAWHGAYASFGRWRNVVARAAGFTIVAQPYDERMPGITFDAPDLDWSQFEPGNYAGEWDKTPDEPLLVLIAHSDCDGVIHPEQAATLADRLAELLPLIDDDAPALLNNRTRTEQFIAGLRRAVAAGEDVAFK